MGPQADDWVLRSARGSVESARRMMEDRAEFQEIEDATRAYLSASLTRQGLPGEPISNLRELLKERASHGFVAGLIQGAIRDGMRIQAGVGALEGERMGAELLQAIARRTPQALEDLAKKSIRFESDLIGNIDRGLILETFALDLARA